MTGIEMIAAERQRQIEVEGWTPNHDDKFNPLGELAGAAAAYAKVAGAVVRGASTDEFPADMMHELGEWPGEWDGEWWKPSNDPIRNLVKAGALIVAEIERLQRRRR